MRDGVPLEQNQERGGGNADDSSLLQSQRAVPVKIRSRSVKAKKSLSRLFLSVACAVFTIQTVAGDLVTEGKYYVCLSEQWLEDFTAFAVEKDFASIKAYLAGDKCLVLRPNLPVTVTDDPALLGTRTAFTIQGIRFYAPSEEIVRRSSIARP